MSKTRILRILGNGNLNVNPKELLLKNEISQAHYPSCVLLLLPVAMIKWNFEQQTIEVFAAISGIIWEAQYVCCRHHCTQY